MKIAIMQPYFFPYIGYFSLIKHTQKFILLDDVQFIRHGWIERNRVLNQNGGWIYIKVPVIRSSGRSTLIKDVKIDNSQRWKEKILAQLHPYKKWAPHYLQVIQVMESLLSYEYEDIVSLNKASLEVVCRYLGFETHIHVFSRMDLPIEKADAPDEWALNIARALGNVKEYWNPEGGIHLFDINKYVRNGIELRFVRGTTSHYSQGDFSFEENLSIIDVLMFNDIVQVNRLIDEFSFL